MKRNKTRSINIQQNPFMRGVLLIANCELRIGVSPAPIPYKKVSEETLAAAIKVVLGDEVMRSKAQELGEKIRKEDGVAIAVEVIHRHLGLIE